MGEERAILPVGKLPGEHEREEREPEDAEADGGRDQDEELQCKAADVKAAERLVVGQPAEPGEERPDHQREQPEADKPEEPGGHAVTTTQEREREHLREPPEEHRPAGERTLPVVVRDHPEPGNRRDQRGQSTRVRQERPGHPGCAVHRHAMIMKRAPDGIRPPLTANLS